MQGMTPIDGRLIVDCANGVGGKAIHGFKALLNDIIQVKFLKCILQFELINDNQFELLNEGCGSEFVQKQKKYPKRSEIIDDQCRVACFDGDADRIVYL